MNAQTLFQIILAVILGTYLQSCGSEEDESNDDSALFEGSLAISTKADLPSCEDRNRQQLVYIKSEGNFYTCEDSGWKIISISGETGAAGADGASGAAGAAGASNNVDASLWVDTLTNKTWFIGQQHKSIGNTCGGSYGMPSNADVVTAMANGLATAASDLVFGPGSWCVWADTTGGSGNSILSTDIANIVSSDDYCNTLCVK